MKQLIGGQAVIEGVMIRGGDYYVTSVRNPEGEIKTDVQQIKSSKFSKFLKKIMIIRGMYVLIETLKIGIKTLNYSADISMQENEKVGGFGMIMSFLTAFIVGILLFVLAPYYLSNVLMKYINNDNYILFNLIDGIIKIGFLVTYIFFISLFKDIRRIFEYHGAEHKVVNTYEKDLKLNMKNIKKNSTLHLRCGTNFLFLVLFVSIFFFIAIPKEFSVIWKISLRIFLVPLIAGTAYEIIRLFNKYPNSKFLKSLVMPGLLLQLITTKEPDEKQIEVALNSTNKILELLEGNKKNVKKTE